MRTPVDHRDDPETPAHEEQRKASKKPYRSPRLITYGNLRQLALVKGGTAQDGNPANPPSKA